MKKILLSLLSLLLVSCVSNTENVKSKTELLVATGHLSSLNYNVQIKKYLIKNYPKIPVSIYEPEEGKQYSSMGIVRLKMVDKNSKLGKYLLTKKNKQYDSLNYFSFLFDVLLY